MLLEACRSNMVLFCRSLKFGRWTMSPHGLVLIFTLQILLLMTVTDARPRDNSDSQPENNVHSDRFHIPDLETLRRLYLLERVYLSAQRAAKSTSRPSDPPAAPKSHVPDKKWGDGGCVNSCINGGMRFYQCKSMCH